MTVSPDPHAPPEALRITLDEPGSVYVDGFGSSDSGVQSPVARAAEAVTSLKVDPGGLRSPPIARLDSGCAGSDSSWS